MATLRVQNTRRVNEGRMKPKIGVPVIRLLHCLVIFIGLYAVVFLVFLLVIAPLSGFNMRDHFILTGTLIGGLIPILYSAYRAAPSTITLDATHYETLERAANAVQRAINRVSSDKWLYRHGVTVRRENGGKTVLLLPRRVIESNLLNILDSPAFRRIVDAALLYVYIDSCQEGYRVIGPWSIMREFSELIS